VALALRPRVCREGLVGVGGLSVSVFVGVPSFAFRFLHDYKLGNYVGSHGTHAAATLVRFRFTGELAFPDPGV